MKIEKHGYNNFKKLSSSDKIEFISIFQNEDISHFQYPDKYKSILYPDKVEIEGQDYKVVEVSFDDIFVVLAGNEKRAVNHIKNKLFVDGFILQKINSTKIKRELKKLYKFGKKHCQCYTLLSNTQPICTN